MATGNFLNRNANKIFAIDVEEDSDFYFTLDDIKHSFSQEMDGFCEESRTESNENRSYYGRVFGKVYSEKFYDDVSIKVSVDLIVRLGYYSGANLDWNLTVFVNGESYEYEYIDENELRNAFEFYGINAGLSAIFGKNANKWVDKQYSELIDKIENIYSWYVF